MTQTSQPWTGTVTGDAGPYSAQDWADMYKRMIGAGANRPEAMVNSGSGVAGVYNGLHVYASTPADTNVNVAAGAALVDGTWYWNDAIIVTPIPANGSGSDRIDTFILRKDFANQTIRLILKAGTPAGSPVPPALTQTPGVMMEVALADVYVANGFVSIAQTKITPRQIYLPASDSIILTDVLNNSGGVLQTGDIVVWDIAAAKVAKTSTIVEDGLLAGVWEGRTDNGSYGRVKQRGFGWVNCGAAVPAINTFLYKSATAKQANVVQDVTAANLALTRSQPIARSMETTAGAGLCFCFIDIRGPKNAANAYFTSTGYTTTSYTFVDIDTTNVKLSITPKGKTAIFAIFVRATNSDGATTECFDVRIDATNRYSGSAVGGAGLTGQGSPASMFGVLTNLVPGTTYTIYPQWREVGGGGGATATLQALNGIILEID